MKKLTLVSNFVPCGDQPAAIAALTKNLQHTMREQILLGVTGSGKTFTVAQTIAALNRPALILAPNKTLAAQLYGEMKEFFPNNAVEYFVSYYDYYQPEAYLPGSDTYIEKDSKINEHIDQMRLSATKALLERNDVIIVASVSAIYGLGDPKSYHGMVLHLVPGGKCERQKFLQQLAELQYTRNDVELRRGTFRVRGEVIDIFPAELDEYIVRVELFDDEIARLVLADPLTGNEISKLMRFTLYPKTHYVTPRQTINHAIRCIRSELTERLRALHAAHKLVEYQRLEQRTLFDLEMLAELGYCSGIENYSRHLTQQPPGEPPPTLFDYLPHNALLFIDESHVTVPQLHAMYRGDRARKQTLVEYGFRLPSALDNRPLRFDEFLQRAPQLVYISATPGAYELQHAVATVELVVRPTGLVDPAIMVRPAKTQIDDLYDTIQTVVVNKERVLVTTLTKRMAENLTEYLADRQVKVRYLHSDIDTVERVEIIRDLRLGVFDVLIGINLLREGLDIPEVALVAILDADKEGFLRSDRSLIQTIGRAARNVHGRVILYADTITGSMQRAIAETDRRRQKQQEYNKQHNITPTTIQKKVLDIMDSAYGKIIKAKSKRKKADTDTTSALSLLQQHQIHSAEDLAKTLQQLETTMLAHAARFEFEQAARIRDDMSRLKQLWKVI